MRKLALSLLVLTGCASSSSSLAGWTVEEPRVETDGHRQLLSAVAQACADDAPDLTCNLALSRARVLLGRELRALLDEVGSPADSSQVEDSQRGLALGSARDVWVQRGVTSAEPTDVWRSDSDDCVWVRARLDLTAMIADPNAPPIARRGLENHLRSQVFPAAQAGEGASCEG